ncbi:hypothetical protein [Candidatus Uabimicrobium sp. HlEnr_7]|uniref:hypothetical protein n=1 Tax=Candidatus Uabimicrobium helgolandensis TaxID=3095367 RepID=UPI003557997E
MKQSIPKESHVNIKFYNYIFAKPILLTWFISAAILNVSVYMLFPIENISNEIQQIAITRVALLSLLGFFLGMFTIWPIVRKVCIQANGGLYNKDDYIFVISGKNKGILAKVEELTVGQGGWELLVLNTKDNNIIEQYQALPAQR